MTTTLLGGRHVVTFGTSTIEYELVYAKRKTLAVQVFPDGSVVVKAPLRTPHDVIETAVFKRGAWILRHQKRFEERPPPRSLPRRYVSGEAYRYLGRQYRLKVVEDTIERVTLNRGYLTVGVRDTSDKRRIADLIDQWYRRQAQRVFEERLNVCLQQVARLGIPQPEKMSIRKTKRRWGSCSGKGRITLSLKLIHVPKELIDYVIVHELCHLKELNHSPKFYALLDRALPDWRERRQKLNRAELT